MAASLHYDGQTLFWNDGKTDYTFKASSGIHGNEKEPGAIRVFRVGTIGYAFREDYRWSWYEKTKDRGPVPTGTYTVESSILKQPWAEYKKSTCTLVPSRGLQHIPRGDPNPGVDGDDPTIDTAGDCDDYWANWGYNRVRLTPHKNMVAPHRNGFYIHDSSKGYSHGCIETEQDFFVKHLFPYAQANSGKRFKLTVSYKHERTYGGTLAGGGASSVGGISGISEASQIIACTVFKELCARLKANKPLPEEKADVGVSKPIPGLTLDPPPQDRLLKYYPAMKLNWGANDLSKDPATLALIPGWWGSFRVKP